MGHSLEDQLILLNTLFIITSIPLDGGFCDISTHDVASDFKGDDGDICLSYFRIFKSAFKQPLSFGQLL